MVRIFDAVQEINSIVAVRLRALEESSYSWLDEILDEAKKAFGSEDRTLLPQTPSVKRRVRRRKSVVSSASRKIDVGESETTIAGDVDNSGKDNKIGRGNKKKRPSPKIQQIEVVDKDEDFVTPSDSNKANRSQSRKRVPNTDLSMDEDGDVSSRKVIIIEEEVAAVKEPIGRRTRAASKAATTKPRAARPPRQRKVRSQEPVLNIEKVAGNVAAANTNNDKDNASEPWKTPESRIPSVVDVCSPQSERVQEWVQSAGHSVLSLKHRVGQQLTPPVRSNKTIEHFDQMTVKEKAQAYEEIVHISPMTPVGAAVRQVVDSHKTPVVSAAPSPSTPETVKVLPAGSLRLSVAEGLVDCETPVSRGRVSECTNMDLEPSTVESRQSLRQSSRMSLKTLPSEAKLQKPATEKPVRPRTRLRLKKKEATVESGSEECGTQSEVDGQTDSQSDADTSHTDAGHTEHPQQTPASGGVEAPQHDEDMQVEVAEVRASTHSKTRHTSKTESQSSVVYVTESDSANYSADDDELAPATPSQPGLPTVKSTRTRTCVTQPSAPPPDTATSLGEIDRQGTGSCRSADGDAGKRVTRSKMRKPAIQTLPACDTGSSDDAFSSPQAPAPRATRTKTRKRQHEAGSDPETRLPKRSCTDSDLEPHTPTNRRKTDEDDSSDSDILSPTGPRTKTMQPHVQSFLNQLKPLNNPVRPASVNRGGLVRSFIARNSPAPKPSQKELQEKRKKELMEKEKKNEERLRKREEEYKKHMEEIKKRREEKNKKVQRLREMKEVRECENRALLQRRLAEKKDLTVKLREDRIREEREKQKSRQQRFDEAEERRRQEEDDRQRKLHEQIATEKQHQELVQRKRDYEEQERQRRIVEDRRKQQEHLDRLEREKEEEKEKQRHIEEQRAREWQKRRDDRERIQVQQRMEKEKLELERRKERELQLKKDIERLREQEKKRHVEQEKLADQQRQQDEEIRRMVQKHNQAVQSQPPAAPPTTTSTVGKLPQPNLNRTHSLTEATVPQNKHKNSYEITPERVPRPATAENYDITDLNSGDETDDEDAPMKKVPDWAHGNTLKMSLIKNHFQPPKLDELFEEIMPIDLNLVFAKKKARFNKRTSSAHWDSPILKAPAMSCRNVNVV